MKIKAAGILCLLPALLGLVFAQVVDCVVAEVNAGAITLTDLRILRAFGLGGKEAEGQASESFERILERAIDRKVVIDAVKQDIAVPDGEVEALLEKVRSSSAPADWQNELALFGLNEEDLKPYLKEVLLFEKVVGLRFSQGVEVSLKEIEAYYNQVVVPSEKARGNEPKPMMQILDSIESQIKREKTEKLVAAWLATLRQQAEVRINRSCFDRAGKDKGRP